MLYYAPRIHSSGVFINYGIMRLVWGTRAAIRSAWLHNHLRDGQWFVCGSSR